MRVLVACEFSGTVREAFKKRGHDASKATCLWLKNLPLLKPTKIVPVTYVSTSTGKRFSKWFWDTSKLKGQERSNERSRTFQGIADAMAEQWG